MSHIQIVGCNNDRCRWFEKGECLLPSQHTVMGQGVYQKNRVFDYDHKQGRLICRNCLEEDIK